MTSTNPSSSALKAAFLSLSLVACTTKPNPDSCVNVPSVCGAGTFCEMTTGLCLPASDDGGVLPDGGGARDSAEAGQGDANAPDTRPPDPTTIAIKAPMGTVYTNGTVNLEIALGGSPPEKVELLRGEEVIAIVPPPYQFAWDTRMTPEASYQVTARATRGEQVATTTPALTVVVDRTPPTVTARTPSADAQGVSIFDDPITMTFSEPLLPASITDAAVALSAAASPVPSKKTLAADGKSLTIEITDASKLALPATVTAATAATVTDLAGNPLALTSWAWSYPIWLELGSPVMGREPRLAIGSDARPVVVGVSTVPQVAKHVRGTMWQQFGTPPGATKVNYETGLALDRSNAPFVAWSEIEGDTNNSVAYVRVAKWTGSGWDNKYPKLDAVPGRTGAYYPAVAVDSKGQPWVAWTESDESFTTSNVYIASWASDPGSWDGTYGVAAAGRDNLFLTLTPADAPVVAVYTGTAATNRLSVWSKGPPPKWEQTLFPMYRDPSRVVVTKSGELVAAIATQNKSILVQKYGPGGWTDYVAPFTFAESTFFDIVDIGLDPSDRPVVAWSAIHAGGDQRLVVVVVRWNGTAWERVGTVDRTNGTSAELVVDKFGRATVAWTQTMPGPEKIVVQMTNR